MKLKYQLFVILLLASATLIAALYAFNSWNFNRGFINYINRSQMSVLDSIASNLADSYERHGSNWSWIKENPAIWRQITRNAMLNSDYLSALEADKGNSGPRNNTGKYESSLDSDRRGPESSFKSGSESDRRAGPRSENGAPPGAPELTDQRRGKRPPPPPLVLADAQKNFIFGPDKYEKNLPWTPIVSHNETVGFLGYYSTNNLPGKIDQVFADQQKNSLALASLLMVALSGLLAAVLASSIVKPVITISEAVGKISRGDYTRRVTTHRRDELGDLSRDVNQLAYTLSENQSARRKWIAEISHELRTPVAILQGEVEAIEDGIRPLNKESLASLHTETLRLSRLISDLHDLSLSDLGALEYQMAPLDLKAVLQQRLAAAGPKRKEREISLDLQVNTPSTQISGDKQRLEQLLDNLLQNSLRYTDTGGQIAIELSQHNGALHVRWSDSSPGLTDNDLPELFDPLYRAEKSRNRQDGGAGLGLAIAQKIVAAHQGQITATHSPLGGVQISMKFPLISPHRHDEQT